MTTRCGSHDARAPRRSPVTARPDRRRRAAGARTAADAARRPGAGLEIVAECRDGPSDDRRRSAGPSPISCSSTFRCPASTASTSRQRSAPSALPLVVFVTAFDQLRAQGVRRSRARLPAEAVRSRSLPCRRWRARASSSSARANGDLERRLLALVRDLEPAPPRLERFVIKSGGRVFFVRADEIDWIEAAGNYVKLHVGADSPPVPRDDERGRSAARRRRRSSASTAPTSSTSSASRNCSRGSTASTSCSCAPAPGSR